MENYITHYSDDECEGYQISYGGTDKYVFKGTVMADKMVKAKAKLKKMMYKVEKHNIEYIIHKKDEGYKVQFMNKSRMFISTRIEDDVKLDISKKHLKNMIHNFVENKVGERSIIYCLTSPDNKKYIGQTHNDLYCRWYTHIMQSTSAREDSPPLVKEALSKYNAKDFVIEEICECPDTTKETMNEYEDNYIIELDTLAPNGLNMQLKSKHHQISKDKMSKARKGIAHTWTHERKRAEDQNLPKYVEHYVDNKGNEGYRVKNSSDVKYRAFLSCALTMEEKLKMAISHAAGTLDMNPCGKVATVRTNEKSKGLPNYMKYKKTSSSEGYEVTYPFTKKGKCFTRKTLTMDNKKQLAIDFLNEQTEIYKKQLSEKAEKAETA